MNLRIPGPTPVPQEVAQAGAADVINHRGPEFAAMLARVTAGVKQVYGTTNDVITLTASGTGAMEAAVANHISPGEKALVVTIGEFGQRFLQLVKVFGGEPQELAFEAGTAADANRVEDALAKDPDLRTVLITHNETSTGVTNPQLKEVAQAAHARGRLVIVDAISSLSSVPCPVDEWDLDVVLSGSQKGWMVAPGLAFVSVSDRAWEAQERCTAARFYMDLRRARRSLQRGETPWTPAVTLVFQLDRAIELLFAEGMQNVYARHHRLATMVRDGVRRLGLQLFAAEGVESDTVTAIRVPEGIDAKRLRTVALQEFDTDFAGGQGPLSGKIIRFGHLGYVHEPDIRAGLQALEGALARVGYTLPARRS